LANSGASAAYFGISPGSPVHAALSVTYCRQRFYHNAMPACLPHGVRFVTKKLGAAWCGTTYLLFVDQWRARMLWHTTTLLTPPTLPRPFLPKLPDCLRAHLPPTYLPTSPTLPTLRHRTSVRVHRAAARAALDTCWVVALRLPSPHGAMPHAFLGQSAALTSALPRATPHGWFRVQGHCRTGIISMAAAAFCLRAGGYSAVTHALAYRQ